MKLISTRKDVSVWIIACYMLSINLICWKLFGREAGLALGNFIGLGTVALFVLLVKHTPKVDKWLETKIK